MPNRCTVCGKPLSGDDEGATKKLVNRGAREFLCIPCLAKKYRITEELIYTKIEEWRKSGCLLFTRSDG